MLISSTIPSPLEALTGRKLWTSLPQVPSTIRRTVDGSRICQELIKRQPRALTQYGMDLEPGQPVFLKEVQGNIWKTATVNQSAKEPDSYWVRYPDNSILRRTHQMIKPRPLPSHLELETQSQERNTLQCMTSDTLQSFQTIFPELGQQALPTGNLAAPALQEPPPSVERRVCHQFPRFLRCYPFHTEEINPVYKGHPTQEVLSLKSTSRAETLTSLQSGICVHQ